MREKLLYQGTVKLTGQIDCYADGAIYFLSNGVNKHVIDCTGHVDNVQQSILR